MTFREYLTDRLEDRFRSLRSAAFALSDTASVIARRAEDKSRYCEPVVQAANTIAEHREAIRILLDVIENYDAFESIKADVAAHMAGQAE